MRKIFIFCCFLLAIPSQAATVGQITAQTTRMKPGILTEHFLLKPGQIFTPQDYQYAQDELHKLRVFKKLDFDTNFSENDHVDIHIDAQDGWYIFPMAFYAGGSKSVGGISLAGGNLFKQGESTFLFVGGGSHGWTTNVGWVTPKHFLNVGYTHLEADQRFYKHHWFNIPAVLSTTDDKEDHKDQLLREIKGTQESIKFVYKYRLSPALRLALRPQYKYISYRNHQLDSGNHHQIGIGLEWARDIRPGMNMGALAGYGLTDKEASLRDLPNIRSGYMTHISYTNGGSWTGSDYDISKLALGGSWIVEFPSRHLFLFQIQAENAFEDSFSEQVTSTDLLSGVGRYDRQLRGKRGAAMSTSFVYYVMRNKTGLLSLAPFYELSYVDVGNRYAPHSGAGVALMYRLWRFPLPFGVNYTHNLQDGSYQVGFVVGGGFGN